MNRYLIILTFLFLTGCARNECLKTLKENAEAVEYCSDGLTHCADSLTDCADILTFTADVLQVTEKELIQCNIDLNREKIRKD